jgi:hypothetical protein
VGGVRHGHLRRHEGPLRIFLFFPLLMRLFFHILLMFFLFQGDAGGSRAFGVLAQEGSDSKACM